MYAFDFIGKSYIKLGDPQQATDYLEQALALSGRLESKVTNRWFCLALARPIATMQQLEWALAHAQQAVASRSPSMPGVICSRAICSYPK